MIQLLINLFERLGIFAIIFIFAIQFDIFKRLLTGKAAGYEKLSLSVIFGIFGIAGTYMGIPIHDAIANSRVVGVALGGILGGPLVGLFAGVVAGGHRFLIDIGGFTALACGIATVAEGYIGSLLYHKLKKKQFDTKTAFFVGIIVEAIQMLIILLLARPFDSAVNLVKAIALPMILVNSIGLAVFVELVSSVFRERERFGAYQAQTALKIALKTLPFLRNGLNHDSASKAAQIILEMTDLDAVAITDESKILAHKGAEEEHHKPNIPFLTSATRSALTSKTIETPMTKDEIGCKNKDCRLGSAIVVPLIKGDKPIGALKLYRLKENRLGPLDMELANGLAHLFSNQLELSEIENQRKLLADAEIRALQSQINPHFLFNAINTVISYTRTNSKAASELLVKLAEFFRKNINPGNENIPLSSELKHCEAYIAIEMARFEDKVKVNYDIDKKVLNCKIPPLILQPIVENALKHGILQKEDGGQITIGAHKNNGSIKIFVKDNGIGMTSTQVGSLFFESAKSSHKGSGVALKNVNARLIALFGAAHSLSVESEPNKGTIVSFTMPK